MPKPYYTSSPAEIRVYQKSLKLAREIDGLLTKFEESREISDLPDADRIRIIKQARTIIRNLI